MYLAQFVAACDPSRIEIHAAALEPGERPSYLRHVPYLGQAGDSKLRAVLRLRSWIRGALAGYDLVHFHAVFDPLLLVGAGECLRRGVPYVVSAHGNLDPWYLAQKRWKKRVFLALRGTRLLRGSAALLATTERNAFALRQLDVRLPVRVLVPGVDVPPAPDAESLRRSGAKLRFVYVGRFEPVKGLETLLDAFARLRAGGVDAVLDMVGWGEAPYTATLKARADELGVGADIEFPGFLDGADKQRRLCMAHALVLPSYSENFSFATAEAMAQGLPVIVTTGVGLADTVRSCDCGIVVPPGDAPALAEAMARFGEFATGATWSQRAHACAQREFSMARMAQDVEAIYSDAVTRRLSGTE